ncbi:MAG: L-serine ammonia-lyase [Bdellovibrionota bacterium]
MTISIVDLFSIGIGPSSSHTLGPMRAAKLFIEKHSDEELQNVSRVKVELFGALGLTGLGHRTDRAVLLGLESNLPEDIAPDVLESRYQEILDEESFRFSGIYKIPFSRKDDLVFHRKKVLPMHSNGMRFTSFNTSGITICSCDYYSIGGGFVWDGIEKEVCGDMPSIAPVKYPFSTGSELLSYCDQTGFSIPKIMMENENTWRSEGETKKYLLNIWNTMDACMQRGLEQEGVLSGSLKLKRRAPALYQRLKNTRTQNKDPFNAMDWVNLYALAVSEENASGGRVVTAPTNGAAGIIPAVLAYYRKFIGDKSEGAIYRFLLTAGAIGILFKKNASISGAEVGCQGEIGVACSMAAGALADVLGGTPQQVENAAEIGIEHNLGLTCDPIGGLVQVPCIERNAMGAVKAINAARLAILGDGKHKVHLDKAIATMLQTGKDMKSKYKETSRGGLAVNIVEC